MMVSIWAAVLEREPVKVRRVVTQGSFDGVLREIFQKSFPYALLRGSLGNANVSEENF